MEDFRLYPTEGTELFEAMIDDGERSRQQAALFRQMFPIVSTNGVAARTAVVWLFIFGPRLLVRWGM